MRDRIVGLVPAGQALPDRQPVYVHSWIYVFGVATLAALAVVIVTVGLFIRERRDDGGISESTTARPKVFQDWVQLEESFVTEGAERLEVRVAFGAKAKKGEAVIVDEVRLKRSAQPVCSW